MPQTEADLHAARESILTTRRRLAMDDQELGLDPELLETLPDDDHVRMRALIMIVSAGALHRLSIPELEEVLARDRETQEEARRAGAVKAVRDLEERCRVLEYEIARRAIEPSEGFRLDVRTYLVCERCGWEVSLTTRERVDRLCADHESTVHEATDPHHGSTGSET